MPTNVQTAAQWGQVIDNLDTTKKSVLTQLSGSRDILQDLKNQQNTLSAQLEAADLAGDTGLMAVIQSQINTINTRTQGAELAVSNLLRDVAFIDQDLNNAFKEQSIALSGPPIGNSTTPPASELPGDPTTVTLPDQPASVEINPVALDQNPYVPDFYSGTQEAPIPAAQLDITVEPDFMAGTTEVNVTTINQPPNVTVEPDFMSGTTQVNVTTINQPPDVTAEPDFMSGTTQVNAINVGSINENPGSTGSARGLPGLIKRTRASKTAQDQNGLNARADWRVRLSLAPDAYYLYKLKNPGILAPLKDTDGIIFPYTPTISVSYAANYDANDLTHSNYKIFQYKSSAVDNISITCDFTAQDTNEANYMLAVIHFLRSVTKMFYGKDMNPKAGTPPPLCFLSGMGDYQFNEHPLVLSNFTYTLPNSVDYIRANSTFNNIPISRPNNSFLGPMQMRLSGVRPGAMPVSTNWTNLNNDKTNSPTYVPTKIQIQINAYPIVSRNAISNKFSLEKYGTGELLLGDKNASDGFFGGIW